jgi:hypothetical protein
VVSPCPQALVHGPRRHRRVRRQREDDAAAHGMRLRRRHALPGIIVQDVPSMVDRHSGAKVRALT